MKEILASNVPHRHVFILALLLGAATLPHAFNLKPSIVGAFFLLIGIRILIFQRSWRMPGVRLKVALTLLCVALVFVQYRTLIGQEGGVSLLTLMLGLKTLEVHSRRDLYLTLFLTYFLILTQFIFNQTILLTLYLLLVVWGTTGLLVAINRMETDDSFRQPLWDAGKLLLQAAPLMAVMFLLFPRLDGPLWSMHHHKAARTGISDTLAPGSFDQLIQSREPAFRVYFEGAIPPPAQRYWRAMVMWYNDGRRWHTARLNPSQGLRLVDAADPVAYTIILEPSDTRWLVALDIPSGEVERAFYTDDFQLISKQTLYQRKRYTLSSFTRYRMERLKEYQQQFGLRLPHNVTARMRALVAEWRADAASDEEVVDRALSFFRKEAFYYTLEPPLLQQNPVDQFLFETRRGFCEHYASAFATLMRVAGIPSRIVAGYQGGELNPMGDYLFVRQSDAHAWTELWLEGRGWVRVDPTAAVAPERIEQSIDIDTLDASGAFTFGRSGGSLLDEFTYQFSLIRDTVNMRWQVWILSYSHANQLQMMDLLGIEKLPLERLLLGTLLLPLAGLALIAWWLAIRQRKPSDPIRLLYDRFCASATLREIPRAPFEGPRAYAERIASYFPDLAGPAREIARRYIALRYGRNAGSEEEVTQLKRLISRF